MPTFPDRPPAELALTIHRITHQGRVRSANEDSFVVVEDPMLDGRGRLVVVADGMGGAVGGALASRMVVQIVRETVYADMKSTAEDLLRVAITNANHAIHAHAIERPELKGMGSTCTAVLFQGGKAIIGHVGDSRAYLVRGGNILQLTNDHTKIQLLLASGLVTPEDVPNHPERSVLVRSIGPNPQVEVDILGPFELEDGDRMVLCSDGLVNHVNDKEILTTVEDTADDRAAGTLLDLALERGGTDNCTVVIVAARRAAARAAAVPVRAPTRVPATAYDEAPRRQAANVMGGLPVPVLAGIGVTAFAALAIGGGALVTWWMHRHPAAADDQGSTAVAVTAPGVTKTQEEAKGEAAVEPAREPDAPIAEATKESGQQEVTIQGEREAPPEPKRDPAKNKGPTAPPRQGATPPKTAPATAAPAAPPPASAPKVKVTMRLKNKDKCNVPVQATLTGPSGPYRFGSDGDSSDVPAGEYKFECKVGQNTSKATATASGAEMSIKVGCVNRTCAWQK